MSNYKKPAKPFKEGNQAALKEIDWALLDNLIGIFCTLEECAGVLELSDETISTKIKEKFGMSFLAYFKQKNCKGKASLRRRQFEMSKTNPALAIWLGKQYLNQKDVPMIDQSNNTLIDKRTFAYLSEKAIQEENDRANRIKTELPAE